MRLFLGIALTLLTFGNQVFAASPIPDDTDGDFLLNSEEDQNGNGAVDPGETNPLNADTDGGGEGDGSEVRAGRDPFEKTDDFTFDRDDDGLSNGQESAAGTDPSQPDTDSDGVGDAADPFPLAAEFTADQDADGLPDEYETEHGFSPQDAADAAADLDEDALSNREEFTLGTDPAVADTDRDGEPDGQEVAAGASPLQSHCLVMSEPEVTFSDITDHWAKPYVERLHRTKIRPEEWRLVAGYSAGEQHTFAPDQPISRAELLKLALMSSCIHLQDVAADQPLTFSDVPRLPPPDEPADRLLQRRIIYTGAAHDIVHGYPDGSFQPDTTINRVEALKILIRATQLRPKPDAELISAFRDVPPATWFTGYVELALGYRLIQGYPDGLFRPAEPMTRGEAAKLVYLFMLENPIVNGFDLPSE